MKPSISNQSKLVLLFTSLLMLSHCGSKDKDDSEPEVAATGIPQKTWTSVASS